MRIAVVVYDGVLDDECEAFRSVLALVGDAGVVTVGAAARRATPGRVAANTSTLTFDELDARRRRRGPGRARM